MSRYKGYCLCRYIRKGMLVEVGKSETSAPFNQIMTVSPSPSPLAVAVLQISTIGTVSRLDTEMVDRLLETKLYFRGSRVFAAVIDDLFGKGMKNAQNVLYYFPGASSGIRMFCWWEDISGARHIEDFYNDVVTTHGTLVNIIVVSHIWVEDPDIAWVVGQDSMKVVMMEEEHKKRGFSPSSESEVLQYVVCCGDWEVMAKAIKYKIKMRFMNSTFPNARH
ncbi:hypothetical protein ACS0TY_014042 [Phlomoides rotata]